MQEISSNHAKRPKDQKLNILFLQMITVAVILLFAGGIRIFGGNVYTKLSLLYHEKFDDITRASDVLDPENDTDQTESGEEQPQTEDEPESASDVSLPEEEHDEAIDGSAAGYISDFDTVKATMTVGADANTFLWPVTGRITSEFGYRDHPITGVYSIHGGMDISAVKGTEIKAAYDGKVTLAGYSKSYGNYVIITHSDNVQTLYAHCSQLLAEEGDTVKKGDVVALVGDTGRVTGPHLHFEIRIGGYRVNPRWLLGEITGV